jgi:hypothetical protein
VSLGGLPLGAARKAGSTGNCLSQGIAKTFLFTEDSPDFSAEFVILHRIGFLHGLL